MRYHVLQHVSFETAGLLEEEIRRRGDVLRTTALYDGELLPYVADFDVLIVMGGPMSIHDEAEYPWLIAEKELIGAAIREGKKVLGICLGAQLIAAACGARVYRNPVKEIGFWPVRWEGTAGPHRAEGVSAAGPHRAEGVSAESLVFHWHGETFDLPAGAERLASTEVCVNQAFRIGDRVLGIQFHPEVTPEIIRGMVDHEGWELAEGGKYVQSEVGILAGARDLEAEKWRDGWLREWL